MNLTFYSAKDYEKKSPLLAMEKQTQSNPISEGIPSFLILMVCGVGGEPVFGEEGKIPEINEAVLK